MGTLGDREREQSVKKISFLECTNEAEINSNPISKKKRRKRNYLQKRKLKKGSIKTITAVN